LEKQFVRRIRRRKKEPDEPGEPENQDQENQENQANKATQIFWNEHFKFLSQPFGFLFIFIDLF